MRMDMGEIITHACAINTYPGSTQQTPLAFGTGVAQSAESGFSALPTAISGVKNAIPRLITIGDAAIKYWCNFAGIG